MCTYLKKASFSYASFKAKFSRNNAVSMNEFLNAGAATRSVMVMRCFGLDESICLYAPTSSLGMLPTFCRSLACSNSPLYTE
jgi:hypothetical protein